MAAQPVNRPQEVRSNDHLQNARRDHGRGRTRIRRRRRRHRQRLGCAIHDEHDEHSGDAGHDSTEHVGLDRRFDDTHARPEGDQIRRQPVSEHGLRIEWLQLRIELRRAPAGSQRAMIAGRLRR